MSDRLAHTLDHRVKTKAEVAASEDAVTTVRRIELITGAGRRRQWSNDDKASIIVESLKHGANVSEVARRHGLRPQQLFAWRRKARAATPPPYTPQATARPRKLPARAETVPAFSPVVLAVDASPASASTSEPSRPGVDVGGRIEIAINDMVVHIIGQVESAALVSVLRAARRAS